MKEIRYKKLYTLWFHLYEVWESWNSSGRNQIMNSWSWVLWEQMTSDGYEKIRGGEDDLCFDYSGGLMTVYIVNIHEM